MYNPMMEVPVPTIDELGLDCDELLAERQNLKKLKDDLETRIKQIDQEVGQKLDQKDIKSVVWNDYLVIRRKGSAPRPILDRVLLLEAGVTPQQLNEGTKMGKEGEPGITVRAITPDKTSGSNGDSSGRSISSSQVFATEKLD